MTNLRHDDSRPSGSESRDPQRGQRLEKPHVGPAGNAGLPDSSVPVSESFAWLWQQANEELELIKEELKRERQRYQALVQRKAQMDSELASVRQMLDINRREIELERQERVTAERELAAARAGWQHLQNELGKLENERSSRLKIERRLALLDTQSDKALELAGQLAKERNLRLKLEREKGMLLNELKPRRDLKDRLDAITHERTELRAQLQDVGSRAAKLELAMQHVVRLEEMLAEEKSTRLSADERASTAEAKAARLEGELRAVRQGQRKASAKPKSWLARLLFG